MTARQRRFVEEYLVDLNATQACIRAGYSAKNADKIGPELLGKTRVAEAVRAAMDARALRTFITADQVVQEFARIAFATIADVVSWTATGLVSVTPSAELDQEKRAARPAPSTTGTGAPAAGTEPRSASSAARTAG